MYFLLDSSNADRRAIARLKEQLGSYFAIMKAFKEKNDSWPKMRHDGAKNVVKVEAGQGPTVPSRVAIRLVQTAEKAFNEHINSHTMQGDQD